MSETIDGRRLVVAYNPHSSRASSVQRLVFDRLDEAGYDYVTLEVKQAPLQKNVDRLAPLIKPQDLILSAAGDGSAHAVAHSVIAANRSGVSIGFLAFGNFNDLPHALNSSSSLQDPVKFLSSARQQLLYPLVVKTNGVVRRHALLYSTIGWTAKAAAQFDEIAVRRHLQNGGHGLLRSLWRVGRYYLESRKNSFLPELKLNGEPQKITTDILCVNGRTVARIFRGKSSYYDRRDFLCRRLDVSRIITNIPFGLAGLLGRMSGDEVRRASIGFGGSSNIMIQCDGEVFEAQGVHDITVEKSSDPIRVLTSK